MTDEEFEKLYGRPPVRSGTQKRVKVYWGRIIIALIVFVLIVTGIVQLVRSIVRHFKKDDAKPAVVNSVAEKDEPEDREPESTAEEPVVEGLQFKVCIDPGHGGTDDGACLYNEEDQSVLRKEKDDTLRMSLAIGDYLKSQGVSVVYTRDGDYLLSEDVATDLKQRCYAANDSRSDLFISIHRNSLAREMCGFEVWAHSKQPEPDSLLATNIMTALEETGITESRGVQYGYTGIPTDNYAVNADTVMPACLVEMGFITDNRDNEVFDKNFDAYAKAVGDAIIKTAKELNIIDENGKRILNEQMISYDKLWYPLPAYYSDPDAVPASAQTE
ncbi:MAG: N-acetylmuramoyl-L-alanine amidase [Ruminococcus sp.]|nr:N-acetylmuramoyl-L-alanine amidase [Ruminococcus sp.]